MSILQGRLTLFHATLWSVEDFSNCEIQFQPECYYRGFRDEFGMFTPVHWKILALKFAFVIIFEHVVFGVCKLIDILVPDIPASLDIKIKRERYLAKEALQDAEHVLHKVEMFHSDFEGLIKHKKVSC